MNPNPDLIARCEREAAAGRRPELEWLTYDCEKFLGLIPWEAALMVGLDGVARSAEGDKEPDKRSPRFATQEAAQLYAESQLREAAAPLFAAEIKRYREALERVAEADLRGLEWEEAKDIAEAALERMDRLMLTDPDHIAVLRDGAINAAHRVIHERDTLDDYLRRLALDEPLTTPPMGADPREVIERLERKDV